MKTSNLVHMLTVAYHSDFYTPSMAKKRMGGEEVGMTEREREAWS